MIFTTTVSLQSCISFSAYKRIRWTSKFSYTLLGHNRITSLTKKNNNRFNTYPILRFHHQSDKKETKPKLHKNELSPYCEQPAY